jgi:diguanylate cyclase (GGDEF)-like protein
MRTIDAMTGAARTVHAATAHLLNELLDSVDRCQREMIDLNMEEVRANCLSALAGQIDNGLALFLDQDPTGHLRLELASDTLPFQADLLRLDLSRFSRNEDAQRDDRAEQIGAAVEELLAQHGQDREAFVHVLADPEPSGVVLVQLSGRGESFGEGTREGLQQVASSIEQILRTTRSFKQLLQRASIDPMTGLYNQKYFASRLRAELSRASRHGHPLGLLFFDLDDFDKCNSKLGFVEANELLREVADLLRSSGEIPGARFSFRRSDVPVRHSGEEFVVLLPETPKWGVLTKAERLRRAIESIQTGAQNGSGPLRLTASIGVAAFPEDASDAASLVDAAVRAMVRAKQAGKNRVEPA